MECAELSTDITTRKENRMDENTNCAKIKILERRLENHLDNHRQDEKYWNDRQHKQDLAFEQSMEAINKNIEAIEALTKSVKPLVDGLTVFITIQKFIKWLSGFAFAGVILSWFLDYNPLK